MIKQSEANNKKLRKMLLQANHETIRGQSQKNTKETFAGQANDKKIRGQ